jgi:hypothetical protein
MDKIKLLGLTIVKYLFFVISFMIVWFLFLLDLLIYLLTFRKLETNLTENFSKFSISVLKVILRLEFDILFKDEIKKLDE